MPLPRQLVMSWTAQDTSDGTADRYRGSPSGPGVPELPGQGVDGQESEAFCDWWQMAAKGWTKSGGC